MPQHPLSATYQCGTHVVGGGAHISRGSHKYMAGKGVGHAPTARAEPRISDSGVNM